MFGKTTAEFLLVGLGNPGAEYAQTRHNVGFCALDFAAGHFGVQVTRLKHMALTGKGEIAGHGVLFMKPQTYMNRSGESVADAARFYKIAPENIILLHDDASLPVGAMRIRYQGSAGGHNGLKSVAECLGSERYARFKFGVGEKPHPEMDLADHVLGKLSAEDRKRVGDNFPAMVSALETIVSGDRELAMSRYNRNPGKEPTE